MRPKRDRDIEEERNTVLHPAPRPPKIPKVVGGHSKREEEFLQGLKQVEPSAAVLFTYKPIVSRPRQSVIRHLPRPLTSLHKPEHEKLDESQLLMSSKETFLRGVMKIQQNEAVYLEECTRLQAKCHLWFEQRIGRITSSKFFQVSRASLDPPPSSVVKEIMEKHQFSTPALTSGV